MESAESPDAQHVIGVLDCASDGHEAEIQLVGGLTLPASHYPNQQNTIVKADLQSRDSASAYVGRQFDEIAVYGDGRLSKLSSEKTIRRSFRGVPHITASLVDS